MGVHPASTLQFLGSDLAGGSLVGAPIQCHLLVSSGGFMYNQQTERPFPPSVRARLQYLFRFGNLGRHSSIL
jgi:hypothetical protein